MQRRPPLTGRREALPGGVDVLVGRRPREVDARRRRRHLRQQRACTCERWADVSETRTRLQVDQKHRATPGAGAFPELHAGCSHLSTARLRFCPARHSDLQLHHFHPYFFHELDLLLAWSVPRHVCGGVVFGRTVSSSAVEKRGLTGRDEAALCFEAALTQSVIPVAAAVLRSTTQRSSTSCDTGPRRT